MPTKTKPTNSSNRHPASRSERPFFLKLTLILAKIAEIAHWILVGIMAFAALISVTNPSGLNNLITDHLDSDTTLSCYGFSAAITQHPTPTETIPNYGAITFFALGSAVVLALMAMIFRNIYLILKTSAGQTWFARGTTPFQSDITRMTREIGIFFLAVCGLSFLSVVILQLSGGPTIGFNYESGFIGLVFLCFSSFFAYGTQLQEDVDGLI